MNSPTPPRRFRFGLRTLFVVVTLASVWFAYSGNWLRQRRELLRNGAITRLEVKDELAPGGLWLFGETAYLCIGSPKTATLNSAARLFPEAIIVDQRGWMPRSEW